MVMKKKRKRRRKRRRRRRNKKKKTIESDEFRSSIFAVIYDPSVIRF
jgi:hypothetical protein